MRRWNLPALGPEGVVTQWGRVGGHGKRFWNRPKSGQDELSLLAGRYPLSAATILIARRDLDSGDAVRYAEVSCLLEAGFEVERTPNHRNPDHVSVKFNGLWDDTAGESFDSCFGEPIVEG